MGDRWTGSMNLHNVIPRRFELFVQTYEWCDAALCALSLGMGADPTDEDELPYGRDRRVVPSMCVILGWPPLWISDSQTETAWTRCCMVGNALNSIVPCRPKAQSK